MGNAQVSNCKVDQFSIRMWTDFHLTNTQAILDIASLALNTTTESVANNLNIESKQVRRFVNLVKKEVNNIGLINKILDSKFKNSTKLYTIIKHLPKEISKIYFENFNTIFLYENNKRNLYIRYSKLSI